VYFDVFLSSERFYRILTCLILIRVKKTARMYSNVQFRNCQFSSTTMESSVHVHCWRSLHLC